MNKEEFDMNDFEKTWREIIKKIENRTGLDFNDMSRLRLNYEIAKGTLIMGKTEQWHGQNIDRLQKLESELSFALIKGKDNLRKIKIKRDTELLKTIVIALLIIFGGIYAIRFI